MDDSNEESAMPAAGCMICATEYTSEQFARLPLYVRQKDGTEWRACVAKGCRGMAWGEAVTEGK